MKKKSILNIFSLMVIMAVSIFSVSCSGDDDDDDYSGGYAEQSALVGMWNWTGEDSSGDIVKYIFCFESDGTGYFEGQKYGYYSGSFLKENRADFHYTYNPQTGLLVLNEDGSSLTYRITSISSSQITITMEDNSSVVFYSGYGPTTVDTGGDRGEDTPSGYAPTDVTGKHFRLYYNTSAGGMTTDVYFTSNNGCDSRSVKSTGSLYDDDITLAVYERTGANSATITVYWERNNRTRSATYELTFSSETAGSAMQSGIGYKFIVEDY